MTTLSLAAILEGSARKYPHKTAVISGGTSYTYAELWQQALGQAAELQAAGIGPGDVVAIMSPNTVDFPRSYFAVLAAGAVVVPVHLLLTAEEVVHVLRDSGAKLLICHPSFAEVGGAAAGELDLPVLTSTRDGETAGAPEPLPTYVTRQAEDPAVVFYTSGTTGKPKGAILTHVNMVMNATVSAVDANDVHHEDIALGCLPLFHVFGQTASMNAVFRLGATLVLLPRFSGEAALELIREHHVDVFHGVPTMYHQLLAAATDQGGQADLPRLRLCVSGGAALPQAVMERFNAAFDMTIYEGYGLSETSPVVSTNNPHSGVKPGTVGPAIWGVDVLVNDRNTPGTLNPVPHGELGEILVRGHNVFAGYLGNEEATAEAMIEGWFRTGDLGTLDDDGFLTIVDRTKDVIIRGGFNVYPREVEEVLIRCPGIAQVAVIGIPDDERGEEVCAVVIRDTGHDGGEVTEEGIIAWALERLAKHKYPRIVRFVDEFPLGPSHKVLKRELRRNVSEGENRR
ncbi:long-chain fatty acid--CoA ligase [Arthrobacter sp. JSM 101049]|uniref:long-chain-fatty-acid--CoA ligase n=1 Tax=Arthrobacter sp. JSM 101049 TaxID=929097 RepID=UPI003561FE64